MFSLRAFIAPNAQCRLAAVMSLAAVAAGEVQWAWAADVAVQPAAGSGFVVKDASGSSERMRVQESGAVSFPGLPGAPVQSQELCMSATGQFGPCSGSSGGSYTAATGLTLTGTTFAIAPTYRLPQSCAANRIAQWDGGAWICGNAVSGSLPVGSVNQTLRYDSSNALVANNSLQAFADGGLVAGGVFATGGIPATGGGTRLMWYPAKAAFREGYIDSNQWDDTNIGGFSLATGYNSIASGIAATAMGERVTASGNNSTAMGTGTTASASSATAMGRATQASADSSTALGLSTVASGASSTAMGRGSVAGGTSSIAMGDGASATGDFAIALGNNATADNKYSVAVGRNVSTGGYVGSFIYGDASSARGTTSNSAHNQFMVLASGGVTLATSPAGLSGTGAVLAPGSSSWAVLSDRNAKTAIRPVDVREVLNSVVAMQMNTWQYQTQDAKYRHMGPMAQDFYAAFQLGESNRSIDTVDADGVALAAIQGLNVLLAEKDAKTAERLDEKDRDMKALRSDKDREIAALRFELAAQKTRISSLELLTGTLAADLAHMKGQLAALQKPVPGAAPAAVAYRQP